MRRRESLFGAEVNREFAKHRAELWWWAVRDDQAGFPDRIGCWHGKFIALELKARGERPEPVQRTVLEDLHTRGAVAGVLEDSAGGTVLWYPGGYCTLPLTYRRDEWFQRIVIEGGSQ